MMDEALRRRPRLIFTQFVEMGHLLKRHLVDTLGLELFLHGGTPAAQRDKMVQAFQRTAARLRQPAPAVPALTDCGQSSSTTMVEPGCRGQATDRAFRGQRRMSGPQVRGANTLEESIHELIGAKDASQSIVGSGGLADRVGCNCAILTLRYDAVEDAEEE